MQKRQNSQISICDSDKIKYRLKELQALLDVTQEEMARLGGRKRVSYAEYVRDHDPKMPGADFIANLVLNTGVNANWLLTGQGAMFNADAEILDASGQALLIAYRKLSATKQVLLVELAKVLSDSNSL